MLFTPRNIRKHQAGGEMAPAEEPMAPESGAPEAAPADAGGQDPIMMLAEAAAQALQAQDCQIAMQVCQGLVALVQQMAGGAPQEPQGEPVFKKGGVLLRRIKK